MLCYDIVVISEIRKTEKHGMLDWGFRSESETERMKMLKSKKCD
jgi:hypothetical protein